MLRRALVVVPVSRVSLNRPGWATRTLSWTRQYTSKPEAATAKPPLPAAPEESTAPLVQSDFTQYLEPLYEYDWGFACTQAAEGNPKHGLSFLRRNFRFGSIEEFGALRQYMRPLSCDITLASPSQLKAKVLLRSPDGVTRSMIRRALELETGYQTICPGGHTALPGRIRATDPIFKVNSPEAARTLAEVKPKTVSRTRPITWGTIVPGPLPSPPSAPPFPPPPLTEADLETYLKPLMTNGWFISLVHNRRGFLHAHDGYPALTRNYRFHDSSSAEDFFHVLALMIPTPDPNSSMGGVVLSLRLEHRQVQLGLISPLAQDGSQTRKYGISHTDVRFAFEAETEFLKNWVGKADNVAIPRIMPTTIEQVWNYKPILS